MSCYMVEPGTAGKIALFCASDRWARRLLIERELLAPHEPSEDALIHAMEVMNRRAYQARYGECPKDEPWDTIAVPRPKVPRLQVLKALACYLYQCSEGDVPASPLFKALDRIRYELAYMEVCDMPEYIMLPWE